MMATGTRALGTAACLLLGTWILCSAGATEAYVLVTTQGGIPAHWEQRCVPWWFHEAGAGGLDPEASLEAVEDSFAAWDAIDVMFVDFDNRGVTCVDTVGPDEHHPRNVVLWRSGPGSWPYAAKVVGLTSLTFEDETGRIVDADIEMNGEDFAFSLSGDPDAFDIQQAVTHEIGHLLGLDHALDPASIMYAQADPGDTSRRQPTQDEIDAVASTHPAASPPDGASCSDDAPIGTWSDPDCPAPPLEPGSANGGGCGVGGVPASAPVAWLAVMLVAVLLRRRPTALVVVVAALIVGAHVPTAAACVPYTNDAGEPISWFEDALTYTLDPDIPETLVAEDLETMFVEGFAPWMAMDCHSLEIEATPSAACALEDDGDHVNCISWVHKPELWPFASHLVAVTLVHYHDPSARIVDVDMVFNGALYTWSASFECTDEAHDLLATVTHEAGHFVGLDHSTLPEATMNAVTFPGDCKKRTLAEDDIGCFCGTYGSNPGADRGPETPGDLATAGDTMAPYPDGDVASSGGDPDGGGGAPPGCGGCAAGGPSGLLAWLATGALLARPGRRQRPFPGPVH